MTQTWTLLIRSGCIGEMIDRTCREKELLLCVPFLMFFLCSFSAAIADAEDAKYPRNDVERPLILPKGMGEVEVGLVEFEWISTGGNVDHGVLSLTGSPIRIKYGLTDNLQINNAGLAYRMYKGDDLELVVFCSLDNIKVYTERSTVIDASAGFTGKLRMGQSFAGVLDLYDEYRYQSSVSDENAMGASLGLMYAVLDTLSVSLSGRYEKKTLAHDLEIAETGGVLTVQENIIPELDIIYALDVARMSDNNSSTDDYTEGDFTIRLKWRW